MRIIAVNIYKGIILMNPMDATKRVWKLKLNKCIDYEYVIGVNKGEIVECFTMIGVHQDLTIIDRVEFDLELCSPLQNSHIRAYIDANNINLKWITTKFIN